MDEGDWPPNPISWPAAEAVSRRLRCARSRPPASWHARSFLVGVDGRRCVSRLRLSAKPLEASLARGSASKVSGMRAFFLGMMGFCASEAVRRDGRGGCAG